MPTRLTPEIIYAAIAGFEAQKKHIDTQIAELRGMLDGSRPEAVTSEPAKRGRRKLSAAARARIAEAQRKRWAAAKQQAGPAASAKQAPAKPKRRLSAAGRKAIIEATKKRWAAVRAAKAQAEKTARK